MKKLTLLTCAIVLLLGVDLASAEASYPQTIRLVRAMRADELTLAAFQANLPDYTARAKWTKQQAACLSQIKYPLFTDAIALELAPQLTDAEVADAIAFYRSEVGRKVTQQSYEDLKKNVDANVVRDLTAQQLLEFGQFAKRPAGRKLIQESAVGQRGVTEKIGMRLRTALEDCEYDANNSAGPIQHGQSCSSVPVRAPNHECSAVKQFVDHSDAGLGLRTRILAKCRSSAHAIAEFKGRLDGVDFTWRDGTTIEVIHPAGAQPEPRRGEQRFKVSYRQRTRSDPPPPQCWPNARPNSAHHVELDELASQPFWMSYADDERCLLSKRIERSKIPGARNDAVVQFRKLSAPQYPFGTSELVLFETASDYEGKSAVIRAPGLNINMVAGERGFHLIGQAAEKVLRVIGSSGVQLEIQPATGTSFRIELSPTDIEWALPPFEQCVR